MSVALIALTIPLRITLSSFHPPVIKYSHKFPVRCFPLHTSTSIPVFSVSGLISTLWIGVTYVSGMICNLCLRKDILQLTNHCPDRALLEDGIRDR
jgi:hypothetical protein